MDKNTKLSKEVIDNTKWPISVRYNGELVGYANADGVINFLNKDFANMIMTQVPIYVSSRAIGEVDNEGRIVEKETREISIINNEEKMSNS
ncbi:MAG TPA: hypothetical protein P5509_01490 [Bacteroidales bacterium]|nr:hypothetical protein [Bacteroidales bacterium]